MSAGPRLAYLADVRLGRQRSPEHHGGDFMTPYLRSANVNPGQLLLDDVKEMNFPPGDRAAFALQPGDILMTEGSGSRDTVGATAVWNAELPGTVCFQNTLLRLRPGPLLDTRFLYWWCQHAHGSGLLAEVAGGQSILHLGTEGVGNLRMHPPDVTEQRRIADFLDDQTTRIDRIIAARARQLLLLDQERGSLLDEVVRGVAATSFRPLKRLIREVDLRAGVNASPDALLSVSIHHGVVPRSTLTNDLPRADLLDSYKVVQPGDLVLNRMRAFQGAVGVSSGTGIVSPDYAVLRSGAELLPAFAHFVFRSPWFAGEMSARIRGIGSVDLGTARTPRINVSDLMEIRVPAPPIGVQDELVGALKSAQDATTAHIGLLKDHLLLLDEFKRSLISAAVSGEFDVSAASGRGVPA